MDFVEYFYTLVKQIPKGQVSTYGDLARALGDIRASRAVGRMLNQNPYAPIVPCHRVVMSDGSLGGFGAGIPEKIKRLKTEGVTVTKGKISGFDNILFTDFTGDSPLKKMREEQKKLKKKIKIKDEISEIKTVCGVDVAYDNDKGFGACVTFDYESKEEMGNTTVKCEVNVPYIPTYLAFRELPVIERLMKKLDIEPSVLLVDGNGILHPYKMGIASHVGVKLGVPTIGVAKSQLCGKMKNDPGIVGSYSEIEFEKQLIGYGYKSSQRTKKPIFISPGHKVSFKTSLAVIKGFCKYKLPEPIRQAHRLATESRNAARK
jgi:deoxyribonuclease V